jgi:membrane protein
MRATAIIAESFSRWNDHDGQRLGAALAFYTLLSAAPLLIFVLLALSAIYGASRVQGEIVGYLNAFAGETAARMADTLFQQAHRPGQGTLAGAIGVATLVFGASAAFVELREDLNKMWSATPRRAGVLGLIAKRIFAFVLVCAAGLTLFILIVADTATAFVTRMFMDSVHLPSILIKIADLTFSFSALVFVLVLVYRFVPDRVLDWDSLWTGAAVTAALLAVTKALLAWYLARASLASAYGAAGSGIAIAVWLYFTAQIFLLGAEFTYVWSRRVETGRNAKAVLLETRSVRGSLP